MTSLPSSLVMVSVNGPLQTGQARMSIMSFRIRGGASSLTWPNCSGKVCLGPRVPGARRRLGLTAASPAWGTGAVAVGAIAVRRRRRLRHVDAGNGGNAVAGPDVHDMHPLGGATDLGDAIDRRAHDDAGFGD